jgi:molybdopterin-binding protein
MHGIAMAGAAGRAAAAPAADAVSPAGPGQPAPRAPVPGGAARLKRGGVLAGLATLLAGVLGSVTGRPAQAADGDALVVGNTGTPTGPQSATSATELRRGAPPGPGFFDDALRVTNQGGHGVVGIIRGSPPTETYAAVMGVSTEGDLRGYGVYGRSAGGVGVFGESDAPTGRSYGVIGRGERGVVGTTPVSGPAGVGVEGAAPGGTGPDRPGGIGVHGRVFAVQGVPGRGTGVLGTTTLGFGVVGEIVMDVHGTEVAAVIPRTSAEAMGLQAGDQVTAVIKATEVMVAK